jgi:nonribosomal peptide synthetase protein VioF
MTIKDFGQWDLFTEEQRELIDSFNRTQAEFESDATLAQLFCEQAERTASNIAVSFQQKQLSYGELDRKSNQLAHLLQRLGVTADATVAVLADRELETYVSILGILKAGGAYVPIDPANPKERIQFLLHDCGARSLLTKSHYLNLVEGQENVRAILLDEAKQFQRAKRRSGAVLDISDIEQCSESRPPINNSPTDLAYVIYTSGSTGMPKGVAVEQRSVINFVNWVKSTFNVNSHSRITQNASIFFDASVQQMFPALTSGATLFPVPEEARVNPALFLDWIKASRISHWDSVPSLWYRVVSHLKEHAGHEKTILPDLKFILLAGEPLRSDMVNNWMERVEQNHRIFNIYGPTEATVDATFYPVSYGEKRPIIPIGRPLQNLEVYVMNKNLQLCMPNVEGEICIGGVGLARGYLNNPELTQASFIQHPLPGREGQRLYRTGDFGRLLPDANLEFVGRKDEQVKIGGQRIELAEVEAVLRDCPGVDEVAVVLLQNEAADNKQLAAYYISTESHTSSEQLRDYATRKLPGFAMPHHFVAVSEFPLTANKKIDKNALSKIGFTRDGRQDELDTVPTTQTERVLLNIWQEVLKTDRIGIRDDFFALGGDSVSSIMVRHKCAQVGIQLKTVDMFKYPTISGLAEYIDKSASALPPASDAGAEAKDPSLIQILPEQMKLLPPDVEVVLPMLPMQQAMFYTNDVNERSPMYVVQSIYRCEGMIDLSAFERALNVVVSRHEALRTIFRADVFPQPVQIILSEANFKIASEDVSRMEAHQQDEYIRQAAERTYERGFSLSEWPLFRMEVYLREADRFDVVWTTHHIIMDGWSTSIFYKELFHAYANFVTQRFRPLPRLRGNFKDYVKYHLKLDSGRARDFWKHYVSELPRVDLPRDFPPQADGGLEIKRLRFSLSVEDTRQVKQFARANGTTTNAVCLSAYYLLLKYVCRQDELTVGVVTSGRSQEMDGVEDLIGCLINTIPLKVKLTNIETFAEAAQAIKRALLEVREHEHFDLSEILKLNPSNTDLFQTLFVFENYPGPKEIGAEFPNTFGLVEVEGKESSNFPLAVVCFEDGAGEQLNVDFEYDANMFREGTVRAWAKMFIAILRQSLREE